MRIAGDPADRLTSVNGIAYTWDDNGNLTNDGVRTYTYDAANRLIAVSGSPAVSFGYDGLGNRITMTVGGATTRYALDVAGGPSAALSTGLPEVIAATSGASTQYLQVQGQILAQYDSGTWGYVAPDALGSVRQLVDPAGSVSLAQSYDPFGNLLTSAGSGSSAFGYTGEQVDASTGLVYLRARYYNSALGRFVSADTVVPEPEDAQSLNRFSYVLNNPLRHTDPSGHIVCGTPDRPCPPPIRIDISPLPPWARQALQVACYAVGCHADVESGILTGPTFEESIEMSLSPNPIGMVEVPAATTGKQLVKEGVEQVCEQAPHQLGALRSVGRNLWESGAGLLYGADQNFGNRVQHILQHTADDPLRKGSHGVFNAGRSGVFEVVDEAWLLAQKGGPGVTAKQEGPRTIYMVDMGRPIGYVGGEEGATLGNPVTNFVMLVIERKNNIITAFPALPR